MKIKKIHPAIPLALLAYIIFIVLRTPSTAGAVAWWPTGGNWAHRKQLTITNNSGDDLAANTTIAVTVDTKSLYDAGKLQSDCDDLRILYQPSNSTYVELTRHLVYPNNTTCSTSPATKVYFPLQSSLSDASNSTNYYAYYANNDASAPSDTENAFDIDDANAIFVCPFNGTTTCVAGETPSTESGAIRYGGSKSALQFDGVNDYISLGNDSDFDFTSSDFTFEGYAYIASADDINSTGDQFNSLFSRGVYNQDGYYAEFGKLNDTVRIVFRTNQSGASQPIASSYTVPVGSWFHWAITRDGANGKIYVDGTEIGSSSSLEDPTANSRILGFAYPFDGGSNRYPRIRLDEIRVSNIARYSSAFTPQTTPFVSDDNTLLLLHLDETGDDPRGSNTAFDDSTYKNNGTIAGAEFVKGLVGTDSSTSDTGYQYSGSYAGHEGIFIEEDTTNKITNPSFEHATYDTNWDSAGEYLTVTEETSAPYYKFGSKSAKIVASGTGDNDFTIGIDPDSTSNHTLSAYVYNGTSGAVGTTVSNTIAQLVWEGVAQSGTTYTDMGGGWWRLKYSTTTTDSTNEYGIYVLDTKTVYVDGVQLEQQIAPGYATSYTDGSLGNGYSWSGTAHASTSTRTEADIRYSADGNISNSAGTVSFWYKPNFLSSGENFHYLWSAKNGGNYVIFYKQSQNNVLLYTGTALSGSFTYGRNDWVNFVVTWSGSDTEIFANGSSVVSSDSYPIPDFSGGIFSPGHYYSDGRKSDGVISDFRVYDDAISSVEVVDLYRAGLVSHQQGTEVDTFGSGTTAGDPASAIWHMDEGTGTTLNDASPNSNNGTISGPTWQTEDMCVSGKCLYFDGSDDYANSSNGSSFNTDNISFGGWFKPTSGSGNHDVIAKPLSTWVEPYYQFSLRQAGTTYWACYFNIGGVSKSASATSTDTKPEVNKWQHVQCVYDGTNPKIYVDGNLANTGGSTSGSITTSDEDVTIGRVSTSGYTGNYFDGFIDEVKIYPYALSAAQVKAQYNQGSSAILGTRYQIPDTTLGEGLVGYWAMDETTGDTCSGGEDSCDSSGNGNHATWYDNASEYQGKYGNGVILDGSDYLSIASQTPQISNEFTVSAWTYHTSSATQNHVIFDRTGGTYGFYVTQYAYDLRLAVKNDGSWETHRSTSSISTDEWHHLVVTFKDGVAIPYIDGAQDSFGVTPSSSLSSFGTQAGSTDIGTQNSGSGLYNGILDEVRYYNRALSPVEVRRLYEWAPGPIAHYKLDDGTGTSAQDTSSNGNTGTLYNTPTWTQGKLGKGLQFEEDNSEYIKTSSVYDLGNTNVTIANWVYLESASESGAFVKVSDANSSGYAIGVGNSEFTSGNEGNNLIMLYEGVRWISTSTAIGTGWHHVAMTIDSSGVPSAYLDGSIINSYAGSNAVAPTNETFIGGYHTGLYDRYTDSVIDDVRIYNYALTEKQIVNVMNGRSVNDPGVGSPVGHAIGEWSFDEGYGTTANDSGLGGNNGTLANLASPATSTSGWQNEGGCIKGKCLAFDGTNDYVEVGTGPTSVQSVSFWTYPETTTEYFINFTGTTDYIWSNGGTVTATGFTSPTIYVNGVESTSLSTGTWQHVVVTTDTAENASSLRIGRVNGSDYMEGNLDEVKIYNFALDQDDVHLLYNLGSSQVLGHNSSATDTGYQTNRWYEAGGAPTPVAAYQPLGASSQEESYTNLANPGTYDASLGVAPDWASGTGWTFDGSTEYLDTDLVLGSAYSAIVRFDNVTTTGTRVVFGAADASVNYWNLSPVVSSDHTYAHGGSWLTVSGNLDTGIMALAAKNAYLNGVSEGTVGGDNGVSANTSYIGARNNGTSAEYYTAGDVIALAIYDQTLTADQVYAVSKAMENLESTETPYQPPVAEWKMDEASGGNAYDTSGNANTGTITGATWAKTCYRNSGCLDLDGESDGVIADESTTVENAIAASNEVSVSMWFNPDSITSSATDEDTLIYFDQMLLRLEESTDMETYVVDDTGDANLLDADGYWTANEWQHVTYTFDNTTARIYRNGIQVASTASYSGEGIGLDQAGCTQLYVGTNCSGITNEEFDGKIDQVKIYDYALSPAQIAYEYDGGGPIAHYRFDECSGTTAYDSSTAGGNDGTIYPGSSGNTSAGTCGSGVSTEMWNNGTTGKYNYSLDFDGNDDYVEVADTSSEPTNDMTLSMWLKPENAGQNSYVIDKMNSGVSDGWLMQYANNVIYWYHNSTNSNIYKTSLGWSNNEWHHVVISKAYADSYAKLYVDGVDTGATENSDLANTAFDSAEDMYIGARPAGSFTGFFNGQIDDVQIFNYALGATEVRKLYNEGSSVRFGPLEGSP